MRKTLKIKTLPDKRPPRYDLRKVEVLDGPDTTLEKEVQTPPIRKLKVPKVKEF